MNRNFGFFDQDKAMDRRSFLRLSGLLGLAAASSSLFPAGAEAVRFDRKRYKVSSTRLAMGTMVSMTLIHESRDQAQEAMGLAFEEIKRLSGLMNRYDGATAVGALNSGGRLEGAPPELREVTAGAVKHYGISGGRFDITVKPVVDLYRDRYEAGKESPEVSEKELEQVLELVDAGRIIMEGDRISFARDGMGITLDGIAKGYIVDRASELLDSRGIKSHIINAGGDIRTRGAREDGSPWRVAIEDPEGKGGYPSVLRMRDGAVATSGNYQIFFDKEKMVHHIVDPRTGLSPAVSASVSILTETAMDADALSTAAMVMDPGRAVKFAEARQGCEAMVIEKSGRTWKSRGWRSRAI
jgi:thiamine biosynthesis lipoprotein